MTTVDIRLKRINKTYHEGETIAGTVVILSKQEVSHQGVVLNMDGAVNLQLSAKSVGMFEAFYNSIKPIPLVNYNNIEMVKPGRFPAGKTELPFEFLLKPKPNKSLYESYHGVFVNIQYMIRVEVKRSLLNKDLQKQLEFIVEYKNQNECRSKPVSFSITPDTLHNVQEKHTVPRFKFSGHLDTAVCSVSQPFTGSLSVENSEATIKSIEMQLVRVETCGCAEGYAKDVTEIQNIQIAEGNVCQSLPIPIYMIFPRLFTCPTLITNNFKVEFEVNIVIVFKDDHLVTENFPIKLARF